MKILLLLKHINSCPFVVVGFSTCKALIRYAKTKQKLVSLLAAHGKTQTDNIRQI